MVLLGQSLFQGCVHLQARGSLASEVLLAVCPRWVELPRVWSSVNLGGYFTFWGKQLGKFSPLPHGRNPSLVCVCWGWASALPVLRWVARRRWALELFCKKAKLVCSVDSKLARRARGLASLPTCFYFWHINKGEARDWQAIMELQKVSAFVKRQHRL